MHGVVGESMHGVVGESTDGVVGESTNGVVRESMHGVVGESTHSVVISVCVITLPAIIWSVYLRCQHSTSNQWFPCNPYYNNAVK